MRVIATIEDHNLCRDDRHPFFNLTLPADGRTADDFPANPKGHFYRGENKILVHRVALQDAYAAGHVLYDNQGQPMTLAEFQSEPANKGQLPWNYDLEHQSGGSAAIDLFALLTAQQRGIGKSSFVYVTTDEDFLKALYHLRANLGSGPIGVGMDPATTTKETSNPSSLTITEGHGSDRSVPLVVLWKEKKAQVVIERLKQIFTVIGQRPLGGRARKFCILGTNERYFADLVGDALAALVPTQTIIESEAIHPAGYEKPVLVKTYLGDVYSAAVNDNHYTLPPGDYFKRDQRMVIKNAGKYDCKPEPDGAHGDTFASGGAADLALNGPGAQSGESVSSQPPDRSRGISMAAARSTAASSRSASAKALSPWPISASPTWTRKMPRKSAKAPASSPIAAPWSRPIRWPRG